MKLYRKTVQNVFSYLLSFDKIADFIFEHTIGIILKDKKLRARVGEIVIEFATGNMRTGYVKSYRLISDSKLRKVLLKEFKSFGRDTGKLVDFIFKLLGDKITLLYEKVIKNFGITVYKHARNVVVTLKDGTTKTISYVLSASGSVFNFVYDKSGTGLRYLKKGVNSVYKSVKGLFDK